MGDSTKWHKHKSGEWHKVNACGNALIYVFKCSSCGLEITKTKKELTSTEKEALKKLKLL